jgi:hypothetical protein
LCEGEGEAREFLTAGDELRHGVDNYPDCWQLQSFLHIFMLCVWRRISFLKTLECWLVGIEV